MRLRAQSYHNLDGTQIERAAASVPWYWRAMAIASSAMILGGFLMLPVTFETSPQLRISAVAIGIFAVAILIAGFCATVLICIVVRSLPYRADAVFMPAFMSCVLGFLTVGYCFIISQRYVFNVCAILTLVFSVLAAGVYATALVITNRRISRTRSIVPATTPRGDAPQALTETSRWQSPKYYENYVRNMFPSASYEPHHIPDETAPISEEELQRQQMLMLLLSQGSDTTPDASSNTFRIEWQGQDHEPNTPLHGYFGGNQSAASQPARNSARLQVPGQLRPWDGIWRGVAPQSRLHEAPDSREARRREIEMGA